MYIGVDNKHNNPINEEIYELLKQDIQQLRREDTDITVIGDFNGHINMEEGRWTGKNKNGNKLIKLIDETSLAVINQTEVCEGKWT